MNIIIRRPEPYEMEAYYKLRWLVLRKPWGQPEGTERDDKEAEGIHLAAYSEQGDMIGCMRLQMNNPIQAQVRYMAVLPEWQGKRVGRYLMEESEKIARESGVREMILHARELAVPFYLACGYTLVEKSYLLFNSIQHYLMNKQL